MDEYFMVDPIFLGQLRGSYHRWGQRETMWAVFKTPTIQYIADYHNPFWETV